MLEQLANLFETGNIMPALLCPKHEIEKTKTAKGDLYCKLCIKEYREANRERILKASKQYTADNRDRNIEYQKQYRLKNNNTLLEKKKIKYAAEHPDMKVPSKYGNVTEHPDYVIWKHMRTRCHNPDDVNYKRYGGRGIVVCDRWRISFDNFMDDMGPRPEPRELYSIDRIDNNKGYNKYNCRWATYKQQANNRNNNKDKRTVVRDDSVIYYPFGKLISLEQFSVETGIPFIICKYRYLQNWSADWIISNDNDSRHYEYKGHKYNMIELSILSGIDYNVIHVRIKQLKWDVAKAVETIPAPVGKHKR